MINASNGGIYVEFCRKTTTQPWFTYFQIAGKYYLKIFLDWPVKYYFWRFQYM